MATCPRSSPPTAEASEDSSPAGVIPLTSQAKVLASLWPAAPAATVLARQLEAIDGADEAVGLTDEPAGLDDQRHV